jgi:hypothetical protein
MATITTNMFNLDSIRLKPKGPPPYKLDVHSLRKGDLFQFTRFGEMLDEVYIGTASRPFNSFYCEIKEISQLKNQIKVYVYDAGTHKSILPEGKSEWSWTPIQGFAEIYLNYSPNVWYKPYAKRDLSRINILEIDEDALIPEDLYK